MRIHLIRKETIGDFTHKHIQSKKPFSEWLSKIKFADWERPADIMKTFPSADLLGNGANRAVFDIGGNKYRMICKYLFGESRVHLFVCWIGAHSEYDKLCYAGNQYSISNY